jgi:hypothetical protein
MAETPPPRINLVFICGAIIVVGLLFFLTANGEHGSAKKVTGDADLPRVTSPEPPENTGSR